MGTEREIFAHNLRLAVNKSYMNQSEIAAKMGVSRGTFSDYCAGRAMPRPDKMTKLCQILGVSQYDLQSDFNAIEEPITPSKDVYLLAQELLDDTDARAIYQALKALDEDEKRAIKTIILKLSEKKIKAAV